MFTCYFAGWTEEKLEAWKKDMYDNYKIIFQIEEEDHKEVVFGTENEDSLEEFTYEGREDHMIARTQVNGITACKTFETEQNFEQDGGDAE